MAKLSKIISTLLSAAVAITAMSSIIVNAEDEQVDRKLIYEFPVTSEVYIYEGQNYHLGDYTELDTLVKVYMYRDGNMDFEFYANDDFEYSSTKDYNVEISNKTSQNEHFITVDHVPYWSTLYIRNFAEYTKHDTYNNYITDDYGYGHERIFEYKKSPTYWDFKYTGLSQSDRQYRYTHNKENSHKMFSVYYDENTKLYGQKTTILAGTQLGKYSADLYHNTIYVDKDNKQFIVIKGEKIYIDDDQTITFTIDDTIVSQDINLKFENDPTVTKAFVEGDVNADGQLDVADVVMLQKWLLTELKDLPNWQAADMYKDDRLDVFDLCIMKRELLKGASA